ACSRIGGCRHGEQGLACVLHVAICKDRVIVHSAAVVILPRDIRGKGSGDDSWTLEYGRQIKLPHPAMRNGADSEGCVKRGGWEWDVVAIERGTRDMQMSTIVCVWLADHFRHHLTVRRLVDGRFVVCACACHVNSTAVT